MKTFWSILGGMAMLALLLAVPVRAEMAAIADSDLSGISGKASNTYMFSGTTTTTITANGDSSANVQFGWFQWTDRHGNSDVDLSTDTVLDGAAVDISNHKGANNQSGANSAVQENVVADSNVINWGAAATLVWITGSGTVTGAINQMPYAVMAVGGF
jgi:hypothetical protein